jgi:hypothetical protein
MRSHITFALMDLKILTVANYWIASIIQGQASEGLKMLGSLINWTLTQG